MWKFITFLWILETWFAGVYLWVYDLEPELWVFTAARLLELLTTHVIIVSKRRLFSRDEPLDKEFQVKEWIQRSVLMIVPWLTWVLMSMAATPWGRISMLMMIWLPIFMVKSLVFAYFYLREPNIWSCAGAQGLYLAWYHSRSNITTEFREWAGASQTLDIQIINGMRARYQIPDDVWALFRQLGHASNSAELDVGIGLSIQ
jgi:hypothetical protein